MFSPASPKGVDRFMVMVASGSRVQLFGCFKTEGGHRHTFFATSPGESKLVSLITSCFPQSCVLCLLHVSRGLLSGETPGTSWHPQPRTVGHRGAEMKPGLCRLFSVRGRGCQLRNSGRILLFCTIVWTNPKAGHLINRRVVARQKERVSE